MTIPAFPTLPGIGFPTRTEIWSTLAQESISGIGSPLALWSYPRHRWTYDFDQGKGNFLRSSAGTEELQTLVGFYNSMRGSVGVFRYDDPDDGEATDQSFGTGDGSTKTFQLLRSFGSFVEPIFAPTGSPVFKVAGSVTAGTLGASGQVTFASAPANGAALTWTGGFGWLCRFDDDANDFAKFMSGLWSQAGLKFTSIKLAPSSP